MPDNPRASARHASAALKRKQPRHPELTHRKRRRIEAQDARVIAAQTRGKAFGDGEVDVDKFVRAREFEITALHDAMQRSKKSLTSRAFQNVPKDLRRRTASHDAKRVPKRLRSRATREMIEDNTPTVKARQRKPDPHMRLRLDTVQRLKSLKKSPKSEAVKERPAADPSSKESVVDTATSVSSAKEPMIRTKPPRVKKNRLTKPPTPKAKFRKRQIHKSWLPTHLFHAKRAHMTPPKEPLWRMAIPLSPTAKGYRPTHRASSVRGAVAWDKSYMSTISLEGVQSGVLEVLKTLGVGRDEAARFWDWEAIRWMDGSRSWQGWLYQPAPTSGNSLAPAKIVWSAHCSPNGSCVDGTPASESKEVTLKRKAIIRIHPSAFLELWELLLPLAKAQKPPVVIEDLRFEIGSIELMGPSSAEAIFKVLRPSPPVPPNTPNSVSDNFEFWTQLSAVTEPASLPANAVLNMEISDPRLNQHSRANDTDMYLPSNPELLKILASWPPDKTPMPSKLFDRALRMRACRQLPSQKAINRRKSLAGLSAAPKPGTDDPRIPVTLLTEQACGSSRGSWTLLLPWKCVLAVWYSLMYYPLSGGGTLRFGGLEQTRQVHLETGTPWFPSDFPGTKAGMLWEQQEMEKRKADWEKRPKGKRIEWESLDLGHDTKGEVGRGWACDWKRLVQDTNSERSLHRIPYSIAMFRLRSDSQASIEDDELHGLVTVRVEMIGRGVPTVCARIYSLPTNDSAVRQKWVSVLSSRKAKDGKAPAPSLGFGQTQNAAPHIRRQNLATILLEPEGASDSADRGHPPLPNESELIGFITTGNFNLGEGKGTGIGSILLSKALAEVPGIDSGQRRKERHLCIVREAGQALGRLARWHLAG